MLSLERQWQMQFLLPWNAQYTGGMRSRPTGFVRTQWPGPRLSRGSSPVWRPRTRRIDLRAPVRDRRKESLVELKKIQSKCSLLRGLVDLEAFFEPRHGMYPFG